MSNRCDADYQRAVSDFVHREVYYCVSCLISECASVDAFCDDDDLRALLYSYGTYQDAAEEAGWRLVEFDGDWYAVDEDEPEFIHGEHPDAEFYNLDAGEHVWFWRYPQNNEPSHPYDSREDAYHAWLEEDALCLYASFEDEAWAELCRERDIEREEHEVYEYWIVSNWFADKLREKGETVGEWMGLTIWGRCTTGQAISMDGTVCEIYDETQT